MNKNESIPNTAAYESATTFEKVANITGNASQVKINPWGPDKKIYEKESESDEDDYDDDQLEAPEAE